MLCNVSYVAIISTIVKYAIIKLIVSAVFLVIISKLMELGLRSVHLVQHHVCNVIKVLITVLIVQLVDCLIILLIIVIVFKDSMRLVQQLVHLVVLFSALVYNAIITQHACYVGLTITS